MNVSFHSIFVLIGVISFLSQQYRQDKPFIAFDAMKCDLGLIDARKDSVINVDFYFTNTGMTTLEIAEVKTSCDCTNAKWPSGGIGKGDRAVITITLRTERISGLFERFLFVKSNAVNHTVVLELSGNVRN